MDKSDLIAGIEAFKKGAARVYHDPITKKAAATAAVISIVSSAGAAAVMKDLYENPADSGVSYTAHDADVHGVDIDKLPPGVANYLHDLNLSLPGADKGVGFSNGAFTIYQQLPEDVLAAFVLSDYEPDPKTSDIGLPEKELRKTYEEAKKTIKNLGNYLSMLDPIPVAGASGFGDSGVDINDGGISKDTGNSNNVKKSSSNELPWYEKILKYIGDWMDRKIDTDAKVDAYANYVDTKTSELTEEQKEKIRCKEPVYRDNTPSCKTSISTELVHNQQSSEKKSDDNVALDASKKDIGSTTNTQPEDKMPVDWNALQKHYTAAKGEIKSDYIEEYAYGSVGDSLVLGFKMKPGMLDEDAAAITIQSDTPAYVKYFAVDLLSDSYIVDDEMTTNPDDFNGSTYYSENGWRILVVPELSKKLKEDAYNYGISVIDKNSDDVRAIELLDKNSI